MLPLRHFLVLLLLLINVLEVFRVVFLPLLREYLRFIIIIIFIFFFSCLVPLFTLTRMFMSSSFIHVNSFVYNESFICVAAYIHVDSNVHVNCNSFVRAITFVHIISFVPVVATQGEKGSKEYSHLANVLLGSGPLWSHLSSTLHVFTQQKCIIANNILAGISSIDCA